MRHFEHMPAEDQVLALAALLEALGNSASSRLDALSDTKSQSMQECWSEILADCGLPDCSVPERLMKHLHP